MLFVKANDVSKTEISLFNCGTYITSWLWFFCLVSFSVTIFKPNFSQNFGAVTTIFTNIAIYTCANLDIFNGHCNVMENLYFVCCKCIHCTYVVCICILYLRPWSYIIILRNAFHHFLQKCLLKHQYFVMVTKFSGHYKFPWQTLLKCE